MRTMVKCSMPIVILFALWGCSSSNGSAPAFNAATGAHPANWVVDHRAAYIASTGGADGTASQCTACHGADLKGGISKVSCFTSGFEGLSCHGHPADFRNSTNHGAAAKGAPGLTSGFSFCQGCHGSGFAGGALSPVSCFSVASLSDPAFSCHGSNSPHPPKPWRSSVTHITTDQGNAPICFACHANGANSEMQPTAPPQAGALPGCFNNTLCHGIEGHPAGWADPTQHGAAAKATPGTQSGFAYCQVCHGADFAGGMANLSCFSASTASGPCHVSSGAPAGSPHAPAPWLIGVSARTHTDTDKNNAKICASCHLNGTNSSHVPNPPAPAGTAPDCFNNTLCHGIEGHPAGWVDPAQHGAAGKANLTYCQYCHAQPRASDPGSNPRFNVQLGRLTDGSLTGCEVCHKLNTAHPEAVQIPSQFGISGPLNRPWVSHNTAGNINTSCVLCHGANLDGGAGPACMTCHTAGLPTVLQNCTSCHGAPPNGTAFPNIQGAHSIHYALAGVTGNCGTCHNGYGSGTVTHFNESRPPAQPPADVALVATFNAESGAAAYASASYTCTNISCHGGKTTPNWQSGTINVLNQCEACHQLATAVPTATTPVQPQYNSYYSGKHKTHIAVFGSTAAACNRCHDMDPTVSSPSQGALNHFRYLSTPAMEGPAWTTMKPQLNFNANVNPPTCSPGEVCHFTHSWTQDPLP